MAFTRPERYIERVFVHCSASDKPEHDDMEVIRRWHTDPKPAGRGWTDVGYHFFIRKTGLLETGRSLERIPAAQRGNNTGTIAICLHGLKDELFTSAQFETLIGLCKEINEAYDTQVTFHGHCEVANKDCPVFDYRRVLGLDADGAMTRPAEVTPRTPIAAPPRPVLRRTSRGDAVTVLQGLLNANGANLVEDGIFGRGTFEAVVAWQQAAGLVADGIVGPATWGSLTNTA